MDSVFDGEPLSPSVFASSARLVALAQWHTVTWHEDDLAVRKLMSREVPKTNFTHDACLGSARSCWCPHCPKALNSTL